MYIKKVRYISSTCFFSSMLSIIVLPACDLLHFENKLLIHIEGLYWFQRFHKISPHLHFSLTISHQNKNNCIQNKNNCISNAVKCKSLIMLQFCTWSVRMVVDYYVICFPALQIISNLRNDLITTYLKPWETSWPFNSGTVFTKLSWDNKDILCLDSWNA